MNTTYLAGAVVTNARHEALLIHRILVRQEWEVPGGKIKEEIETDREAAAREAKEELGIEVEVGRCIARAYFGGNEGTLFHYTWFAATITSGTPMPQEIDRHDNVGYFDIVKRAEEGHASSGIKKLAELIVGGVARLD